ncbi:hypothetical protein L1049_001238 [Liquidambar formosana]|uniref:Uncharacterized protein n=1 Tax=Liquidambar formosana TaxID=63359 RepID=A0AAP0NA86_LIQFO
MARVLSQTLFLRHVTTTTTTSTSTKSSAAPIPSLLFHRLRSTQSGKAQLIEIDFDSSDGDAEVLGGGIRKLEDLIHRIIVQRSAPAWLPFIPGSSYWVPPKRKPHSIVDLLGKLANPLTEEEALSLTTVRGWPCSTHFIPGMLNLLSLYPLF